MSRSIAVQGLSSGELAASARVNVETLRFYERKGLLPKPPRRASGYRAYPAEDVQRIRFIKRAQELGFSLVEIRELLGLRVCPTATSAAVKDRVEEKIADVRRRIAGLKEMEKALTKLSASCSGRGPTADCPILHHLEGDL